MSSPDVSYAALTERDIRSADREYKRMRDNEAKWRYGARPKPDALNQQPLNLARPCKKPSANSPRPKMNPNINKGRSSKDQPECRVRVAYHVKEELQSTSSARSLCDMLPDSRLRSTGENKATTVRDTHMPYLPQPLGFSIKVRTLCDTERMVLGGYEVVDDNGQLLRGRRARMNLRHGQSTADREDDGFMVL
jgi:hypothetical protein